LTGGFAPSLPQRNKIKKEKNVMKKTYVDVLLKVVSLTEDVVRTSGEVVTVYEDEQPDYAYSNEAWEDRV
jgi:hypothetical protein